MALNSALKVVLNMMLSNPTRENARCPTWPTEYKTEYGLLRSKAETWRAAGPSRSTHSELEASEV